MLIIFCSVGVQPYFRSQHKCWWKLCESLLYFLFMFMYACARWRMNVYVMYFWHKKTIGHRHHLVESFDCWNINKPNFKIVAIIETLRFAESDYILSDYGLNCFPHSTWPWKRNMEDPEQHLVAFDASRPNQTTAYRIVMKGIGTVPCNIWKYMHTDSAR